MGNELSHSNTDPGFLAQMSSVYQGACAKGMACDMRTGGAPSMFRAAAAEIATPAPANKGTDFDLG